MANESSEFDFDYVIVGSGFGGSVSALRLAEKGYSVAVIEQGRRWTPQSLPKTSWQFWDFIWSPQVGLRGFFKINLFKRVMVLSGCGVGGGSITYAQTLLVPPEKIWQQGTWKGLEDWQKIMPAYYDLAKRMLGVTENRRRAPADDKLYEMAKVWGCEDTFKLENVGVFFGDDDKPQGAEYNDPYFGGAGPKRKSCNACGGCMVGCKYDSKNTLDKNYLYLAEQLGVEVKAETKVLDVSPIAGAVDGSEGYRLTLRPTFKRFGEKTQITARSVIFSAASLGTQDLLLRMKDSGALPNLSEQLGKQVRTNSESLLGVRYPGSDLDLSTGIAIGSGIQIDQFTHVEATRYPSGSNIISFLFTPLTGGKPGITRPLSWLGAVAKLLVTNPVKGLRALMPYRFANETMIFLVMQTVDAHIDFSLKRPWFWPFSKQMTSSSKRIPTFIPEANNFTEKVAKATDGIGLSSISEILFNVPTTAHCMGGCCMGDTAKTGVIDNQHRVHNYKNLFVIDGSTISSNLGVNPSLTITALAERAMSFIPPKEDGAQNVQHIQGDETKAQAVGEM
ncbi:MULTISPECIES: GMC family oxidoreductase [Pseudomonas]|uniref:GMC family oxidoreductase n=1 Tax=Pseudomonas TaxID=286 RepID=UPI0030035F04